jgi:hypothetical protein
MMTGTQSASFPTLFYWSCKIALIVSFWFWIFSVFPSFGLEQQEPTTKPSKQTLSTELLTARQEWPDITVNKGKVTNMADAMIGAVPADKAEDRATQVSLKLPKCVSARNCLRPLAQPRDSTMREEHAALGWTKSTDEGRKNGSA